MDFVGVDTILSLTMGLLKDKTLQLHYSWTQKEQNINWMPTSDPLSDKDICNHLAETQLTF